MSERLRDMARDYENKIKREYEERLVAELRERIRECYPREHTPPPKITLASVIDFSACVLGYAVAIKWLYDRL